jgi:farnesyl-diphosphate farnesyltransferase
LNCSAEMVLNALSHADECIFFMAGLKEQSVFNFCAIPQAMAIATLDLCFRNYPMFLRNIKITKGEACQIMLDSTQNLQMVCDTFRKHIHSIRKKNRPQDPNFLKVSIACGKVEQFIESIFPSQNVDEALAKVNADNVRRQKEVGGATTKETLTLLAAVFAMLMFITFCMVSALLGNEVQTILTRVQLGIAHLAGARFDVVFVELRKSWEELKQSGMVPSFLGGSQKHTLTSSSGHSEL